MKSLPLIRDDFWTGTGVDSFQEKFMNIEKKSVSSIPQFRQPYGKVRNTSAHNFFLLKLVETGIGGFIAFLLFLSFSIYRLNKSALKLSVSHSFFPYSVVSIISEIEQPAHFDEEMENVDFHKLTSVLNFHSEKTIILCKNLTSIKLRQPVQTSELAIIPSQYHGTSCEQLLAWTTAHLFTHTGEISTIAFLMGAENITLPGKMQASLKNDE